jgi:hypothetical protein
MTEPATPHVMAASPSVAVRPTSLSDDTNNGAAEEAAVSSFYCLVYFESEKAGSKDHLRVLFAMAEGHGGLNFPKHTDPPFIEESKIYVTRTKSNQTKPTDSAKAEVKRRFNSYVLSMHPPQFMNPVMLQLSNAFAIHLCSP